MEAYREHVKCPRFAVCQKHERHQSMWDFLTGGVELNVNLSAQAMVGLNYPVQTLPWTF